MPEGVWNNGIDITPDDRFLFVVGSDRIFRVDLETKEPTLEEIFLEYYDEGDGGTANGNNKRKNTEEVE